MRFKTCGLLLLAFVPCSDFYNSILILYKLMAELIMQILQRQCYSWKNEFTWYDNA